MTHWSADPPPPDEDELRRALMLASILSLENPTDITTGKPVDLIERARRMGVIHHMTPENFEQTHLPKVEREGASMLFTRARFEPLKNGESVEFSYDVTFTASSSALPQEHICAAHKRSVMIDAAPDRAPRRVHLDDHTVCFDEATDPTAERCVHNSAIERREIDNVPVHKNAWLYGKVCVETMLADRAKGRVV